MTVSGSRENVCRKQGGAYFLDIPNGHGKCAAPDSEKLLAGHPNETRHDRFPDGTTSHSTRLPKGGNQVVGYLSSSDGTTGHSTRQPKGGSQVAGYPPAGERDRVSLREFHVNHSRHGMSGFTLIEIMVVLLICLGLVTLMTTLYQSVGKSAIALRGGQQEWNVQQQMREQLLHLFNIPANLSNIPVNVNPPVAGQSDDLYLASWQSGADASSGKPVLGYYHYEANEGTLYYQETPLPAWWQNNATVFNPSQLQSDVRATPSRKVLTGVDSLEFFYLKKGAADMRQEYWERDWRDPVSPVLIQLQFTKAGRNYTIWFETRSTDV